MAEHLVLDANIVIDYLNSKPGATRFVEPLLVSNVARLHPVVVGEVLVGSRSAGELRLIDAALNNITQLTVKPADFTAALDLVRRHFLSNGSGWPDCLVAATCLRLKLPLVTCNDKHFKPIRGLRVIRPY